MVAFATQVAWLPLSQAQERAARDGKPVLLDFSATPE
jgi:hypothetical protein